MKAFDLVVALNSSLLTVRIGSGHPETPSFKANHVYRIRAVDGDIVYIERDERGSGTNGWSEQNFRLLTDQEYLDLCSYYGIAFSLPCELPSNPITLAINEINNELNNENIDFSTRFQF